MADTLEVALRTAAFDNAALKRLLGAEINAFRWWDSQLRQGSEFPAVVVLVMPGPQMYTSNARLPANFNRVQFTIWDVNPERAREVETALASFLDTFNGIAVDGLAQYPNEIVGGRAAVYPQPEPIKYLRIIDAMVYYKFA